VSATQTDRRRSGVLGGVPSRPADLRLAEMECWLPRPGEVAAYFSPPPPPRHDGSLGTRRWRAGGLRATLRGGWTGKGELLAVMRVTVDGDLVGVRAFRLASEQSFGRLAEIYAAALAQLGVATA
jgi:hypothetical protein